MIIYTVGTLLAAFLGYIYSKYGILFQKTVTIKDPINKRHRFKLDILQFIPMIPLALIGGIRYDVGQDYMYTYVPIFRKVLSGNLDDAWGDIGYTYLNKLVTFFTDDYAGIFIVTSCLFIFFVFKAIYLQSDNIPFSIILLVFMGYYFCSLNGVRQMIAVAILLYSIKYIQERNFKKFIICIMCASLIHLTALIFIPVYFIYNLKINKWFILASTAATFVLARFLGNLVIKILMYTKYSWYMDSEYRAERVGYVLIMINIMLLLFAIILSKDFKNDIFLKLQWMAVLSTAFIGVVPVANRIQWIFGLPSIILVPNVICEQKKKSTRVIFILLIFVLYTVYFIYTIGVKNSNSVLPYQTIFSR